MVRNTDRDWRLLGEDEPYWGVVTHDEYRRENLTEEAIKKFYETGERYADLLFETIRNRLDPGFAPDTALDFGCGVGRVSIPLAKLCKLVVGVDVSPGMVAEARRRCVSQEVTNARFVVGDDSLECITQTFDLINTFIVLQHIPPHRGMRIVSRLTSLLSEGGVCALHLVYAEVQRAHPGSDATLAIRIRFHAVRLAKRVVGPLVSWIRPRVEKTGPAPIRSYEYDLSAVFTALQDAGVRRLHVEYTDHAGLYGVILFFQRMSDVAYMT